MSRSERIMQIVAKLRRIVFAGKPGKGELLKQHGIGPQQFWVLRLLAHHDGPLTTKELASELGVTSSAVSQLVDPLVEQGMVTRAEDQADRRVSNLSLSPKARTSFLELRRAHLEHMQTLFEPLTDQEVTELEALLGKLDVSDQAWRDCVDHAEQRKDHHE